MDNITAEQIELQIERVSQLMIAVCQAKTTRQRARLQIILAQERSHLEDMVLVFAKENVIRA